MMRVSIESMEPMGEMCRITRILFIVIRLATIGLQIRGKGNCG